MTSGPGVTNQIFLASWLLLRGPLAAASMRLRSAPWLLSLLALVSAGLSAEDAPPAAGRGIIGQIQRANPGPWGQVEYTRIVIEPPEEFMAADYVYRDFSLWNFPGYDQERLESLWRDAGLSPAQMAVLRAPAVTTATAGGLVVRAPAALVRDLSADARARLYNTLATLPGNPLHQMPFRFRADMVGEWLDDPALPAPVLAAVRRLLYRRGNSVLFSDPDLVLPLLPDAAGRVRLIKTLSRKSTLLVRVRVGRGSDIDALAEYWGRGPRRKDVKPLLQSLARHPDGIALDIAHLLPRFARGLLYTYPPRTEPVDPTLDCHWTSLNFFRDEADRRFADVNFVLETLSRDYERLAPGAPRLLGDVLLLTRPNGEILHSCVYVVDDIVFTKNGYSYQMPWALNTMRDMLAAYPEDSSLEVHAFRRKE